MTTALADAAITMTDKEALQEAREYEAQQKRKENVILDARMEYGHLMTTYMSLVNMFWLGYGAFFTINSLLATALGVSYSANAAGMSTRFLYLVHVLIPSTGIFMSACAIYAAILIVRNMRRIEKRGKELETDVLHATIFSRLGSRSWPFWTSIGSLCFAALWVSTFFALT